MMIGDKGLLVHTISLFEFLDEQEDWEECGWFKIWSQGLEFKNHIPKPKAAHLLSCWHNFLSPVLIFVISPRNQLLLSFWSLFLAEV